MHAPDAYRALIDMKAPARVTFIGDLHGKPAVFVRILRERGLPRPGPDGHLVVVLGDFLDRGILEESRGNLHFVGAHALCDRMVELKRRWPEAFVVLMGNHEMAHLEDVDDRALGEGDRSRFLGLGDLPLTKERLALLSTLPLALRLHREGEALVAVHAGFPPGPGFELAALEGHSDVFEAIRAPSCRSFTWNDPDWKDWLSLFGRYSREDLLRFLACNGARWFLRGHRLDSWAETFEGGQAMWNLHSASGARCQEQEDEWVSWVEWDRGSAAPRLEGGRLERIEWNLDGLDPGPESPSLS